MTDIPSVDTLKPGPEPEGGWRLYWGHLRGVFSVVVVYSAAITDCHRLYDLQTMEAFWIYSSRVWGLQGQGAASFEDLLQCKLM